MTRTRTLHDPATGKTWTSRCEAAAVQVRAGAPGKEKDTERHETDAGAATAWAEKEEWGRLKKGWLLSDPGATAGEPRMLRYRGRAYTGALTAEDVSGQLLCNQYDEALPGDRLFLIDADGGRTELPDFPINRMSWKARYLPALQRVLFKADHQILAWTVGAQAYEVLTAPNRHPVSCLAAVGSRGVWYAEPDLVVTDLATGQTLLRRRVDFETHGGHSPQMEAAIAPDGTTVACCAGGGEIILIDVAGGHTRATLRGDFAMITKLEFSADGTHLLGQEQYGHGRLLCFDLDSLALRADWPTLAEMTWSDFALSPDNSRLAVTHRAGVEIFDWASMTSRLRFRLDHVVKRCKIAWVGGRLGVQTDYGCAGLYVVT